MIMAQTSDVELRMKVEEEIGYNWEELCKLAKQLERDMKEKFVALGQLASKAVHSESAGQELGELDLALRRLSSVLDMMAELMDQLQSGGQKPGSANAGNLLTRHREVFQEYHRDLRKLRVIMQPRPQILTRDFRASCRRTESSPSCCRA